jgi:hypothetical protein
LSSCYVFISLLPPLFYHHQSCLLLPFSCFFTLLLPPPNAHARTLRSERPYTLQSRTKPFVPNNILTQLAAPTFTVQVETG